MLSIQKRFYKIGEVSEILEIPLSTLRFWEKNFTLIRPGRTPGGVRVYTPADIEKIRMVHYLVKDKGMTLQGAEQAIKSGKSTAVNKFQAIERLRQIRNELAELKEAIDYRLKRTARS